MSQQRIVQLVSALAVAGGLMSAPVVEAHVLTPQAGNPVGIRQSNAPAAISTASGLKREIFGFALASSLSDPTYGYPSWNFSALSTVAFFGLHINSDGTIAADSGWSVWSSSALTGLLSKAHANNAKVVLTVILQDFQPGAPAMCAGLAHRGTTVTQVVAQVAAKHVDGVNVDYEGLNGVCPNGWTANAMFTDFVHQLRAGLPSGSYLSVDTYASSATDPLGFFNISALNSYVDSFFVMAYDLEYSNWRRSPPGCNSFCLGPTAPLTNYYYNDTSTAGQYISVVGTSKVILGVPYYGRKACVGGVAPNAYPTGPVEADTYVSASGESTDPAVTPGSYTAHRDAKDPTGQVRWDTWFNASLGCTRELYWDDVTSLGAKYDLVNRDGLRGVGIWNLNYGGGAPELWTTLLAHFGGCSGVAVSSSPVATSPVGTAVTLTAVASGCPDPTPLYGFWLQAPGSTTWQLVQLYSAKNTFTWTTTGKAAGTYHFSVWALDAKSTGIYGNGLGRWDSYAAVPYALTPTPCTAVSAAFSPPQASVVGASVTVTGAATGCPNPRYEFWMLPPRATSWRLGQGYSASATFIWFTAGQPPGAYRFSIWARDASSPGAAGNGLGTWDSYASVGYTLIPPCSAVRVATSPPATTSVGTLVQITGMAVGCAHPVYEFWMLRPGSSTWQPIQAYGSSPTFNWTTSSMVPGIYEFSVWARDSASSGIAGDTLGRWDAYTPVRYTLVKPCTAVSATFLPSVSAKAGSTVAVTAAASGCVTPLYAFWIQSPGSATWQLMQGYGSKATFSWITAGKPAGTYHVSVWARDAGSGGTAGDALGRWDSYSSNLYQLN